MLYARQDSEVDVLTNYHEAFAAAKGSGRLAVRVWVVLGVLVAGLGGGGCARARVTDVDRVYRVYESGDYSGAYKLAREAESYGPADRRLDAAYVAGLSAYRLNRLTTAAQYLTRAAGSADRRLSGDAMASLGMVYGQMGRYGDATRVLLQAADRLDGHDAANAYYYAAVMQRKNGQWPQARTNLILARSLSPDAGFRERVDRELHVAVYTLQTGAFASAANARRAAHRLVPEAARLQLGAPRVVQTTAHNGRPMALVQVGRFDTYDGAVSARQRLGQGAIVVPAVSQ